MPAEKLGATNLNFPLDFFKNPCYNLFESEGCKMRQISKRVSELAAWDLDSGSRKWINQSTIAHRRLKKVLRKQDRKRLNKYFSTLEEQ